MQVVCLHNLANKTLVPLTFSFKAGSLLHTNSEITTFASVLDLICCARSTILLATASGSELRKSFVPQCRIV